MWLRTTQFSLVCWLLMASLVMCVCGAAEGDADTDEDLISVTDEDADDLDQEEESVFVPTKDWKVVKEGQHIPPGLHVRMDFQTGIKEAKLLEEEEEEEEGQPKDDSSQPPGHAADDARAHYYGDSDRRGVVNKRTKVFSTKEVETMLKDINNDTVDLGNLPQLASSSPPGSDSQSTGSKSALNPHLMKTDREGEEQETKPTPSALRSKDPLPVTRHQEVEEMLELLSILVSNTSSVTDLCQALEELEYYVHQIQNAHDLNAIGGLVLVVRLLNHTNQDVKSWAARVVGSASQRYDNQSWWFVLGVFETPMHILMELPSNLYT